MWLLICALSNLVRMRTDEGTHDRSLCLPQNALGSTVLVGSAGLTQTSTYLGDEC